MNDEAVYRTAPATPGLLKITGISTEEKSGYQMQEFLEKRGFASSEGQEGFGKRPKPSSQTCILLFLAWPSVGPYGGSLGA